MTDDELRREFNDLRSYIDERTRDMETRLLRGFERWAIPYNSRVGSAETTTRGFSDRLTSLEGN